jgi:phosphinothricin acetyltransferase
MELRESVAADVPAITSIYNDIIKTSTAVYSEEPVSLENRMDWWQSRRAQGYPVLVATEREAVTGFASFGDFRAWPGYRFSVEHTVHIDSSWRGRGVGGALVRNLILRAQEMGKHVMIGGVDGENKHSLHFHQKLGFEQVAHFRQIGYKFDRFLDLIFVQYWLTPPR